jgi:hypothetical protein
MGSPSPLASPLLSREEGQGEGFVQSSNIQVACPPSTGMMRSGMPSLAISRSHAMDRHRCHLAADAGALRAHLHDVVLDGTSSQSPPSALRYGRNSLMACSTS